MSGFSNPRRTVPNEIRVIGFVVNFTLTILFIFPFKPIVFKKTAPERYFLLSASEFLSNQSGFSFVGAGPSITSTASDIWSLMLFHSSSIVFPLDKSHFEMFFHSFIFLLLFKDWDIGLFLASFFYDPLDHMSWQYNFEASRQWSMSVSALGQI